MKNGDDIFGIFVIFLLLCLTIDEMKRYSLLTGKGAPKNRKYCITRALFLHVLNEHCAPKFTWTVIHFSEEPSITVSLLMLGLVLEKNASVLRNWQQESRIKTDYSY